MARAYYNTYALDDEGRPISGATVEVREIGTTTAIAEQLYAEDDSVGNDTKTNPFTATADGLVEFYLDTPKIVDIFVTKTGFDSQTFRAHVQQLLPVTLTLLDSGTPETQRDNINFLDGFVLTDDAVEEETEVTIDWGLTAEVEGVGAADDEGVIAKPARVDHVHDHGDQSATYPDGHHDKSHAHDGVDGSGTVSHDDLTDVSSGDHHAQAHTLSGADHTGEISDTQHGERTKASAHRAQDISYAGSAGLSGATVEAALDELDSEKSGTAHTHAHSAATGIGEDDHHPREHSYESHITRYARVRKTGSAQVLAHGNALANVAKVSFAAAGVIFDNNSFFDDANDAFTAPGTGIYDIIANVAFESLGAAYNARVKIIRMADSLIYADVISNFGNNDGAPHFTIQAVAMNVSLTIGDKVVIQVAQDSGGNVNIEGLSTDDSKTYFFIRRVD